ncbi:MAG TPA: CsbD family protein [Chryseosolibacter sp.]
MVKLKMKGDWNVIKGKLKQQFANLTDEDLLFIKDKEEELVGRLQQRIGRTKQQIRDLLTKL